MKPFIETLKIGDANEYVKDLQERLIQLGCSTCLIDGKTKTLIADGDFGPITESCLESFQAKVIDGVTQDFINEYVPEQYKNEFIADGQMDFAVHYVLENFDKLKEWYKIEIAKSEVEIPETPEIPKMIIVEKIIELAKAEIGTVESGGNNYGKRVQEYQKIGSNGEVDGGSPWCQYFINFLEIKAANELGYDYQGIYSGYTPTVVNWGVSNDIGKKNCTIDDVEIGDWGFVYSATRKNAKHVFLVIGKSGNYVETIEGNTNSGGGSDGFGVFKRKRPIGTQCWAIVKWWKKYE